MTTASAEMYVISSKFLENCENANNWQDDLSKTTPYFPFPATSNPATEQDVVITAHTNGSGVFLFYMNGESFRGNYE